MEEFVAGAIAGTAGQVIGHPLEVLKVQMQIDSPTPARRTGEVRVGGSMRRAAEAMKSKGLTEGAFRGLTLPLAAFTAVNSVFFGVYSHTLAALETARPDCHHGNVMLAGMAGGAAQLPLVTPIEMVKTAMQAQVSRSGHGHSEFYRGPLHCALSIVKREGLIGLNRGFAVTLARDVPSYGLYMLAYDWLARTLVSHGTSEAAAMLLAGGVAGSLSWLPVLPIDTVKSNVQADAGAGNMAKRSGVAVARQLYASHGLQGFFRGGLVASLTSFPVSAVTFYVWEKCLQLTDRSGSARIFRRNGND